MNDKLIIFDLDNTILNGDSDYSWIKFMIDSGNVNYEEYSNKNDYFYEQYYLGKLDYHEWALFVLSTFSGKTPDQLEKLLVEFLLTKVSLITIFIDIKISISITKTVNIPTEVTYKPSINTD